VHMIGIVSFGQVAVEASSLGFGVPRLRPGEDLHRAGLAYKATALTVGIIAAGGHN
jgi:hypothetical protein